MFSGSNLLILYAALFIGVLLLVEGLYQIVIDVRSGPRAQINRRMKMLESGSDPHQILQALRRKRTQPRVGLGQALAIGDSLERLITQAGLSLPVGRLLLWQAVFGAMILAGLGLWTPVPRAAAAIVALAATGGLPLLYLRALKRRRMKLFGEQLPAALDLLVRSLRVGHPLSAALGVVAQELPDPIGSEFGIVVDEVTYGLDLQEAIDNMNERIDLPDLRYMTVAISIQHNSGGNLAEILAGLSKVIRDRFQMFRKVKAVSAEGRLSAVFLSVFPFVLATLLWLINPTYYSQVADDPMFPFLAGMTVVLLVVNIFVMRWLVNFRV